MRFGNPNKEAIKKIEEFFPEGEYTLTKEEWGSCTSETCNHVSHDPRTSIKIVEINKEPDYQEVYQWGENTTACLALWKQNGGILCLEELEEMHFLPRTSSTDDPFKDVQDVERAKFALGDIPSRTFSVRVKVNEDFSGKLLVMRQNILNWQEEVTHNSANSLPIKSKREEVLDYLKTLDSYHSCALCGALKLLHGGQYLDCPHHAVVSTALSYEDIELSIQLLPFHSGTRNVYQITESVPSSIPPQILYVYHQRENWVEISNEKYRTRVSSGSRYWERIQKILAKLPLPPQEVVEELTEEFHDL